MHALVGHDIRYERSFLLDLKNLPPAGFDLVRQFAFQDFYDLILLHDLSEFRQLDTSGMFYRFTIDHYLISLEIAGRLVKFLRVLPKPQL
ncbi:cytotoxic translational repressor of toxin-antitoxin stability system [Leptolyngbya sp. FACHB-36]|uniref:cytotoxic translational repressor of toxin-antitoxin stability system n=1 Tax=Leptolyngbya sp. FACHB-36 TaxID=2692808 RepID=UPI001680C997|nr:cytotoxic translational repressor of toxin-antitoxin stability system [Leptolyngbya sp. FACHB-36]MBD2022616.1 cytotoxic translational repressor of toxin-antitoxin stability system [Leptolyngbya sp. FACHB-36]